MTNYWTDESVVQEAGPRQFSHVRRTPNLTSHIYGFSTPSLRPWPVIYCAPLLYLEPFHSFTPTLWFQWQCVAHFIEKCSSLQFEKWWNSRNFRSLNVTRMLKYLIVHPTLKQFQRSFNSANKPERFNPFYNSGTKKIPKFMLGSEGAGSYLKFKSILKN